MQKLLLTTAAKFMKGKKRKKENLHICLQKYAWFSSHKQYSMRRHKCES